jgi:NAD(P)H-hydrate epimerase
MSGVSAHWILTAAAQHALDQASSAAGVPQDALMESAGAGAARWILDHHRSEQATILVGPGGNGGDGLVVARHLHTQGVAVRTFKITAIPEGSAAARMVKRLVDAGASPPQPVADDASRDTALDDTGLIVDAVFGSGLTRPLEGPVAQVVERVNRAPGCTVSLDLPSGLPADTGTPLGASVHADVTLAMAFLKPAHVLYPAATQCGRVEITPVAYPEDLTASIVPWALAPTPLGIRARLPQRPADGHKGTFGRVLAVAGSAGMTGAAMLCCRGALRVGAGLVYLAVPEALNAILESALPEVITRPTASRLADPADPRFEALLASCDALAIGPGLSRRPDALEAAAAWVDRFPGAMVIDADALPVTADPKRLRRIAGRAVLTPHPGEMAQLIGGDPEAIDRDRREVARSHAEATGCVVVLKGRPTTIAGPGGTVFVNPTGHDGLACGGSGDVLTGMIAGLLASGASPEDAAVTATHLHGAAADRYARRRAARSLIPSDLLDLLPEALFDVERCV